MAIYYIDPHTTTNGDGSFASPWSLSSATRTGLTAGDEIRVKGVALTSLLTATSYTATVTNNYQLTLTAGGGLGADWVAGDIGYLPAYDTFFKVSIVSSNIIQVSATQSLLPIYNWSTTSLTVRRIDTTTYPVSTTSNSYFIGSAVSGITVSDCWTAATTRVTDGSVKTLFNTSFTSTAVNFYPASPIGSSTTGWVVNLQNTAVMPPKAATAAVITNLLSTETTYNIGQIYSYGGSGTALNLGTTSNWLSGCTVNITHYCSSTGFGIGTFTGQNNTINITNASVYYMNLLFGSAGIVNTPNNTVNITNFFTHSSLTIALMNVVGQRGCPELNVNLTTLIDQYDSASVSTLIDGYGRLNLTIGSALVWYKNKRASTQTSFTNGVSYNGNLAYATPLYVPTYSIPSGWTVTNKYNLTTVFSSDVSASRNNVPNTVNIIYPETTGIPSGTPNGYTGAGQNILMTFANYSSPKEILSVGGHANSNSTSNTNLPVVTGDASVYKTTGPSLKSNLVSRVSNSWVSRIARAKKTIKIPCTSGTSYTVAGFIRTDDTAYTNGDCRVSIYLNDEEVVGQDMTTACENAWEGFSLNFTAAQTAEYVLVWSMYYANGAKSYWLDDLTIS